jgi:hypothetical protein
MLKSKLVTAGRGATITESLSGGRRGFDSRSHFPLDNPIKTNYNTTMKLLLIVATLAVASCATVKPTPTPTDKDAGTILIPFFVSEF